MTATVNFHGQVPRARPRPSASTMPAIVTAASTANDALNQAAAVPPSPRRQRTSRLTASVVKTPSTAARSTARVRSSIPTGRGEKWRVDSLFARACKLRSGNCPPRYGRDPRCAHGPEELFRLAVARRRPAKWDRSDSAQRPVQATLLPVNALTTLARRGGLARLRRSAPSSSVIQNDPPETSRDGQGCRHPSVMKLFALPERDAMR